MRVGHEALDRLDPKDPSNSTCKLPATLRISGRSSSGRAASGFVALTIGSPSFVEIKFRLARGQARSRWRRARHRAAARVPPQQFEAFRNESKVRPPPALLAFYQSRVCEDLQVVAHGGLPEPKRLREVARACLASFGR